MDQGTHITSTELLNLASVAELSVEPYGIKIHNAVGNGERYHAYHCGIYDNVRSSTAPNSSKVSSLLSLKAANSTVNQSSLIPLLLVFGIMPWLPIRPANTPEPVERIKALVPATNEMPIMVTKRHFNTVLKDDYLVLLVPH